MHFNRRMNNYRFVLLTSVTVRERYLSNLELSHSSDVGQRFNLQ